MFSCSVWQIFYLKGLRVVREKGRKGTGPQAARAWQREGQEREREGQKREHGGGEGTVMGGTGRGGGKLCGPPVGTLSCREG